MLQQDTLQVVRQYGSAYCRMGSVNKSLWAPFGCYSSDDESLGITYTQFSAPMPHWAPLTSKGAEFLDGMTLTVKAVACSRLRPHRPSPSPALAAADCPRPPWTACRPQDLLLPARELRRLCLMTLVSFPTTVLAQAEGNQTHLCLLEPVSMHKPCY